MSEFTFKKAQKRKSKLRLALFGIPGSGKTITALRIAKGIGGRIGLIDTEKGRASKYENHPTYKFSFDTIELNLPTVDRLITAINAAAAQKIEVLIVDSFSHTWNWLTHHVDTLAEQKFRGNSFRAWTDGTPLQNKVVDAILSYPGHIICSMRAKMEYNSSKDERGKTEITRVGLAPQQGKDIEFEFDVLIQMQPDNSGKFLKDITEKYKDKTILKPDEDVGCELLAWLNDGAEPEYDRCRILSEIEASTDLDWIRETCKKFQGVDTEIFDKAREAGIKLKSQLNTGIPAIVENTLQEAA